MLNIERQILDISETEALVVKLCENLEAGDIFLLKGELGVGKTTFSRFLINNLYKLNQLPKPSLIPSPTYPILLTYDLKSYEVYHYDLYRIKHIRELEELDFFENIKDSITLVEWPELIIENKFLEKYYLINLDLYANNKRIISIKHIG